MRPFLDRVVRFLRSRRLAIWLLLACTGWAVLGTLVPQSSRQSAQVAVWIAKNPGLEAVVGPLGLHDAYANPVFLLLLTVLAASTIVCSIERTRWALRASRPNEPGPGLRRKLDTSPDLDIAVVRRSEDLGAAVGSALRATGLRVAVRDGIGVAEAGRAGVFGSPLFHWSLALLFVVVGLGQMTRGEAQIGVSVGDRLALAAENYGRLDRGPWYAPRYAGLEIAVPEFKRAYDDNGYDRGPSPRVQLFDAGRLVADQWVYPNNPLRYGSLLIHQLEYGASPIITVADPKGAVVGFLRDLEDFSDESSTGMHPVRSWTIGSSSGPPLELSVSLLAAREGTQVIRAIPPTKKVRLTWSSGAESSSTVLVPGEGIQVPGGRLALQDVVYYARISVADDWSIYPIYALFGLATLGLTIAIFAPRRAVWYVVDAGDGGMSRVRAVIRHWRGDPVFRLRVEDAVRAAAGVERQGEPS